MRVEQHVRAGALEVRLEPARICAHRVRQGVIESKLPMAALPHTQGRPSGEEQHAHDKGKQGRRTHVEGIGIERRYLRRFRTILAREYPRIG